MTIIIDVKEYLIEYLKKVGADFQLTEDGKEVAIHYHNPKILFTIGEGFGLFQTVKNFQTLNPLIT